MVGFILLKAEIASIGWGEGAADLRWLCWTLFRCLSHPKRRVMAHITYFTCIADECNPFAATRSMFQIASLWLR